MMPLGPGFVALEIGCGRGAGAGIVLREFRPSWIYASDVDTDMLRKATGYLPAYERNKLTLLAADVSHLPVKSAALDAVFGFGVIHHVLDWHSSIAEISRVLKPGGVYFLEELYPSLYQNFITKHILLHPTENRFRSMDLRNALDEAGLHLTDSIEFKALGILGAAVKEV